MLVIDFLLRAHRRTYSAKVSRRPGWVLPTNDQIEGNIGLSAESNLVMHNGAANQQGQTTASTTISGRDASGYNRAVLWLLASDDVMNGGAAWEIK